MHPTTLRVAFVDAKASAQEIEAQLLDESEQGLAIATPVDLPPGTKVSIRGATSAGAPGKLAGRRARVQWCSVDRNGAFQAGLCLEEPPAGDRPNGANAGARLDEKQAADFYEVLQLSPKADPETIHRVFRIVAQRYHPDNPDTGSAEMFRALMAAYGVLSDPEKRAAYDVQRAGAHELRWKIFDTARATQGAEAEKRKRRGMLSLLYTKRVSDPQRPTLTIREFEDLLGCPREHLEFSLWYLKERGLVTRSDSAHYSVTIQGIDAAEAAEQELQPVPQNRRLAGPGGQGNP